ncbi:hypothetical protein HDU83_009709 [Entophlyctis luteolus]|nr:hypothetical protein HDU83_009709 [Entophlyctis luteolus]
MKPKRSIPVSARPPPSVPSSASRAHAATHTRSPAHAPESSAPNPPSSRNRRPRRISTTTRINSFHALSKRIAHLKKSGASDLEIDQVRLQIDALGGLHAYQRASLKGGDERSGRGACGKWLASKLEPIFLSKAKLSSSPSCHKLRLLDVGALNGQTYERYSSWIAAEYIDLNPQHSNVIRQDFFERPLPKIDSDKFDVICLCLVVNFVDDPARRAAESNPIPSMIVIHSPDEAHEEPCLSYGAPDDFAVIPNPTRLRHVSLVASVLQLLPLDSRFAGTNESSHSTKNADSVESVASVSCYEDVISFLFREAVVPSKLGKRFIMESETTLPPDTPAIKIPNEVNDGSDSENSRNVAEAAEKHKIDSRGSSLNASLSNGLNVSQNALASNPPPPFYLSFSLSDYAEHESVDVVTLLRKHFGFKPIPQFFFGGRPQSRTDANRTVAPGETTLLKLLPTLLLLVFNRPLSYENGSRIPDGKAPHFHRTSVELPTELDIGFLAAPNAATHSSPRPRTFFRLHAFVTQTDARFLVYARNCTAASNSGSGEFWKINDDGSVAEEGVDLGARVCSKGVVAAVYRVAKMK